ncbi:MAG: hypothetical protein U0452_15790 [Anaerolineae bacterium]
MAPEMTVVLMVDQRRARAERALRSVVAQSAISRLAVLLFDFGHSAHEPLPGSDHSSVRVIPSEYPSTIGAVRLQAFQLAETPLVAFLEEHTMAWPGWAEALLARFSEPEWEGVGAEVHSLNPGLPGDALFVMNYVGFAAPAVSGPRTILQGNNSAYRREVVLNLTNGDLDELRDLLEIESLLNTRMGARGHRLFVEAEARFAHANEHVLLTFWEGNLIFSRLFGALRSEAQGWSAGERWSRILAAPALPFLRVTRLLVHLARHQPQQLRWVLRELPAVFSAQAASVIGQTMGLLVGPGESARKFLFYELNAPRDEFEPRAQTEHTHA